MRQAVASHLRPAELKRANAMTATVDEYNLVDDDFSHQQSGNVHVISRTSIGETYREKWPAKENRPDAFTRSVRK